MEDLSVVNGKVVKDGMVAVKYYQSVPKKVWVNKDLYLFNVRASISMCWVRDEHLNNVLNTKKTCCGGSRKRVFRLANESDVRRWTAGGGR